MEKSLLLDIPSIKVGVFDNLDFEKSREHFHPMQHSEPHIIRRKLILAKYPEVQKLCKNDPISIYFVIFFIILQLTIAYYVRNSSWPVYLSTLYFVGATISHSTQALVHDLTHFLCFESIFWNKFAAILCNMSNGIPSAISFGRYHKEHHMFMDIPGLDPDLPTQWEINFFVTPFRKLIFIIFMPFFYSFRPYLTQPKLLDRYELLNYFIIFSMDYLCGKYLGASFVCYLVLSGLIGMGFHPTAMHVIAEHYEFVQGQETYSYYGILNIPNLNLGYHIEHHDFPMIPWRKLPELRKIAPEFYENLPEHKSYIQVAYNYVFNKSIGPWSRVARFPKEGKTE